MLNEFRDEFCNFEPIDVYRFTVRVLRRHSPCFNERRKNTFVKWVVRRSITEIDDNELAERHAAIVCSVRRRCRSVSVEILFMGFRGEAR